MTLRDAIGALPPDAIAQALKAYDDAYDAVEDGTPHAAAHEAGCVAFREALSRAPSEAAPREVTRFEVIDHRSGAPVVGRVFSAWDCRIELSYQDGGRTLKVFVDGDATTANVPPPMPDAERAEKLSKVRADRVGRAASRPEGDGAGET